MLSQGPGGHGGGQRGAATPRLAFRLSREQDANSQTTEGPTPRLPEWERPGKGGGAGRGQEVSLRPAPCALGPLCGKGVGMGLPESLPEARAALAVASRRCVPRPVPRAGSPGGRATRRRPARGRGCCQRVPEVLVSLGGRPCELRRGRVGAGGARVTDASVLQARDEAGTGRRRRCHSARGRSRERPQEGGMGVGGASARGGGAWAARGRRGQAGVIGARPGACQEGRHLRGSECGGQTERALETSGDRDSLRHKDDW